MHALFRTTDDCKPVDGGRRIFISSSGGGVALVDRETRRASFSARVTNAHSIEMLPGGRIAAAASVSTAGTGNRLVIFDAATGKELASDELRSAHGAVWDDARGVLWALGGDVLRAYNVGPAGGPTRLERTFEIALPSEGGHDLVAVPGSSRLFLSTVRRCFYFDRDRRQLSPHDALGDRPISRATPSIRKPAASSTSRLNPRTGGPSTCIFSIRTGRCACPASISTRPAGFDRGLQQLSIRREPAARHSILKGAMPQTGRPARRGVPLPSGRFWRQHPVGLFADRTRQRFETISPRVSRPADERDNSLPFRAPPAVLSRHS